MSIPPLYAMLFVCILFSIISTSYSSTLKPSGVSLYTGVLECSHKKMRTVRIFHR